MSEEDKKKPAQQEQLDGSDQVAVRQAKLSSLSENGQNPFHANWEQTHASSEAIGLLIEEEESGPEVSVAGRIVAFRLMGKAAFLKLLDREGKIQAYVRKDEIGEENYEIFSLLDIGDFIGVEGMLSKTKTGELTIFAKKGSLSENSFTTLSHPFNCSAKISSDV